MGQEHNPQRKQMRLRNYDYSQAGYYFVTICVKDRKNILYDYDVEKNNENAGAVFVGVVNIEEIAGGCGQPPLRNLPITAGGIAQLTQTGRMVLHYLQNIGKVYDSVKLDCFVIMPNHIHFIVVLKDELSLQNRGQRRAAVGSRPYERHMAPTAITIPKIINTFKTLTSKKYGQPLWQRNYYEHIIRDELNYRAPGNTLWTILQGGRKTSILTDAYLLCFIVFLHFAGGCGQPPLQEPYKDQRRSSGICPQRATLDLVCC